VLQSALIPAAPAVQKRHGQELSFWANLREECRALRTASYSRPARFILAVRDRSYLAATLYFTLKTIAVAAEVPFGIEVNGIDWLFLASLFVILMLFVSIVSELPAAKIARHLMRRA
jgi:hypothetical protein